MTTVEEAERADGYALGSPGYLSYMAAGSGSSSTISPLASWAKRNVTGKPYVAFLTHGGGGNAIRSIEKLAADMKLVKVADSLVCQGAPSGSLVARAEELGKALTEPVAGKG